MFHILILYWLSISECSALKLFNLEAAEKNMFAESQAGIFETLNINHL